MKAPPESKTPVPTETWLVEDEESFWDTIKMILEPEYSVRCFPSPERAWKAIEEEKVPLAILLDL